MLYCEKCGVRVLGSSACCPLCRNGLAGEPEPGEEVYPKIPLDSGFSYLRFRLLTLVVIGAAAICLGVFLCWPGYRAAALYTLAGLGSGWITIAVAIKKRGKPLKAVFWQVCVLSLLAFAWDCGTGYRGWSLDYVLPSMYTCTLFAMAVTARLLCLHASDYLLYLILNIFLGLVPLVLLFSGALRVLYPAVICAIVSVIFLSALILFEGPALKGELIRRLHL